MRYQSPTHIQAHTFETRETRVDSSGLLCVCVLRHIDRGQCRYSLSLLLRYSPKGSQGEWPLTLKINGTTDRTLSWPPGTALAYKGMEVPHGRAFLPAGHESYNLFLHYTDEQDSIHNY